MEGSTHSDQRLLQRLHASEARCEHLLQQITLLKCELKEAKSTIPKRWQNLLITKEMEWVITHDEQMQALLQIIQHQEQVQANMRGELSTLRSQVASTHIPTTVSCSTQTQRQIRAFSDDNVGRGSRSLQSKHKSSAASSASMQSLFQGFQHPPTHEQKCIIPTLHQPYTVKRSQLSMVHFKDEGINVGDEFKTSVLRRLNHLPARISNHNSSVKSTTIPLKPEIEICMTKANDILEAVRRCKEAEDQNQYLQERLLLQQSALDRFLNEKLHQAERHDFKTLEESKINIVSDIGDLSKKCQQSDATQDTAFSPRTSKRPLSPAA